MKFFNGGSRRVFAIGRWADVETNARGTWSADLLVWAGTPIAGAGHHASATAENLVLAGLISVALATIGAVALLIAGVRGQDT